MLAVHVVEKAGGAPDKAGVEQRREYAEGIFAAVESAFGTAGTVVTTEIRYGTDVAETVIAAAGDWEASAILFSPREGSRWLRLLTGDVALSLLTGSDRPVVVLVGEDDATVDSATAGTNANTDADRSDAGADGSGDGRTESGE